MRHGLVIALALVVASLAAVRAEEGVRAPSSVLLIAGQSREEFRDYLRDVCGDGTHCPRPAGATFYTSLDLNGFASPHANAPGDHHQDLWYLTHVYQPLVIQIGLWLGRDQLPQIASGELDERLRRLASALDALERPVFVRIGYEFDGPHNRYPPETFVPAYRRIAKALRTAPLVQLVWHSYAMLPTYEERDVLEWYPGDDVVDWLGVSFFQVGTEGFHKGPNRERILEIARQKGRPVMVAEASAIRYTSRQKTLSGKPYWDYWYAPFFDFVAANDEVKAASIINVNWDSQAQHRVLDWGDSRLHADPHVLAAWRREMKKPHWVHSRSDLHTVVRHLSRHQKRGTGEK